MESEPEILGRVCKFEYTNRDFLARGTFGTVYRARLVERGDLSGDESLAAKTIFLKKDSVLLVNTANWTKLRERWIKVLNFSHEHLVGYHQAVITTATGGKCVEFLMDYCNDGDLAGFLETRRTAGTLTEPLECICYATQISAGLEFLHENNIIHGDMKPGNVFVMRADGGHHKMLVGDLDDLVQMHRSVTVSHDISDLRGTIRYMSPEMLKKFSDLGTENPGRKTDIWSLGCIIHELVDCCFGIERKQLYRITSSGALQYFPVDENTTKSAFAMKIIDGYVPLVHSNVPVIFAGLLRRCYATNGKHRMSAKKLKSTMLEIVRQLTADGNPAESVCSIPQCICRKEPQTSGNFASIRENLVEGMKDHSVLCVHQFQASEKREKSPLMDIRLQLFMPFSTSMQEVEMSSSPYSSAYVPSGFILKDNQLICQVIETGDSRNGSVEIMALRFDDKTWRRMSANFEVRKWSGQPVVLNNKIYFCDRNGDNTDNSTVKVAEVHEDKVQLVTEEWQKFSEGGSWILATHHDRKLLFFQCDSFTNHNGIGTQRVLIYDTEKGKWERLPDTAPRRECAFAALGDYLYVLGGSSDDSPHMSSCMRIDMKRAQIWEPVNHLRRPRNRHGAFVVDNRIYVYGGTVFDPECRTSGLSQSMEVYDPEFDTWSELPFLNRDNRCLDTEAFDNTVCLPIRWKYSA